MNRDSKKIVLIVASFLAVLVLPPMYGDDSKTTDLSEKEANNAKAILLQGMSLLKAGENLKAKQMSNDLVTKYPHYVPGWFMLAECAANTQDFFQNMENEVAVLREALKANPDAPEIKEQVNHIEQRISEGYLYLATPALLNRNYAEAIRLSKLAQHAKDTERVHETLYNCYHWQGNETEAAREREIGIKMDPSRSWFFEPEIEKIKRMREEQPNTLPPNVAKSAKTTGIKTEPSSQ